MNDSGAADLLSRYAPDDVGDAIAWLTENGYAPAARRGESTFGAQWHYTGEVDIIVTVDRSQWMLDLSTRAGGRTWQYDLIPVARAGRPYAEVLPRATAKAFGEAWPDQLPEGVSWRETLPAVVQWLRTVDATVAESAPEAARRERSKLLAKQA